MNVHDQPKLAEMLQDMCEIYNRAFSEVLTRAYYRVLKAQSFDAVSRAVLQLLGDDQRRQVMPTAAEVKALAKRFEQDRGKQRFLPCQEQGCTVELGWPPDGEISEHSYYCPGHKPMYDPEWPSEKHLANRITPDEKRDIAAGLSPKGAAFLRSILPQLMIDIPVSEAEKVAAAQAEHQTRPQAFRDTAEGIGVNASVFLSQPDLSQAFGPEYIDRRRLVRLYGFHWDVEEGRWKRRQQTLSDEQIDRFPDAQLLEDFVRRSS